jgi:hypothetical protein
MAKSLGHPARGFCFLADKVGGLFRFRIKGVLPLYCAARPDERGGIRSAIPKGSIGNRVIATCERQR